MKLFTLSLIIFSQLVLAQENCTSVINQTAATQLSEAQIFADLFKIRSEMENWGATQGQSLQNNPIKYEYEKSLQATKESIENFEIKYAAYFKMKKNEDGLRQKQVDKEIIKQNEGFDESKKTNICLRTLQVTEELERIIGKPCKMITA